MLLEHLKVFPVLFLALVFAVSCVPQETGFQKSAAVSNSDHASFSDDTLTDQEEAVSTEDLAEDITEAEPEENTIPEAEATLGQEVTELEKLGGWEEGVLGQAIQEAETDYDFPVTINRQVQFYLDFFQNQARGTFSKWLARSGRYLPLIQQQLSEAGLPRDLAYLPMIESGFSLTAYSTAQAAGPWQFMSSTASQFDLEINDYVDERRDPIKSTAAAVEYLSYLYKEFGSWHLAVAAYNAGGGAMQRAVSRTNTTNFWEIAKTDNLFQETKLFVPKLIAAIILAKNPKKYGFTDIQYEAPLAFDVLEVPRLTSLKAVALAGTLDFEELRNLNRHLRLAITPPDAKSYPLKVPLGKKELVAKNLPRIHTVTSTKYNTHIVKRGESLKQICQTYNLSATTLLKANDLKKAAISTGQRLRIPVQTVTYQLLAENQAGPGQVLFLQ